MSKYDLLWKWISENGQDRFILTFAQIEEASGVPIDHSFLMYKKELLDYGYRVAQISLKDKTVSFEKVKS